MLLWTEETMFSETIEAWDNGPVVAELWHDEHRGRPAPAPSVLTNAMLVTIGYVVNRYGRLSARDLIELTHAEAPWNRAFVPDHNVPLSLSDLTDFFSNDDQESELRASAIALPREELQRAVEAVSAPTASNVEDDSRELADLIRAL